jgi:hypothetical protein
VLQLPAGQKNRGYEYRPRITNVLLSIILQANGEYQSQNESREDWKWPWFWNVRGNQLPLSWIRIDGDKLFDKLFGAQLLQLLTNWKQNQRGCWKFAAQADQKLLGDVTEFFDQHQIWLTSWVLEKIANSRREKLSQKKLKWNMRVLKRIAFSIDRR